MSCAHKLSRKLHKSYGRLFKHVLTIARHAASVDSASMTHKQRSLLWPAANSSKLHTPKDYSSQSIAPSFEIKRYCSHQLQYLSSVLSLLSTNSLRSLPRENNIRTRRLTPCSGAGAHSVPLGHPADSPTAQRESLYAMCDGP